MNRNRRSTQNKVKKMSTGAKVILFTGGVAVLIWGANYFLKNMSDDKKRKLLEEIEKALNSQKTITMEAQSSTTPSFTVESNKLAQATEKPVLVTVAPTTKPDVNVAEQPAVGKNLSLVEPSSIVFDDVNDEKQIRVRAKEFLAQVNSMGMQTRNPFTEEEVMNWIRVFNGVNPYGKEADIQDMMEIYNRTFVIMNNEMTPAQNTISSVKANNTKQLINYGLLFVDGSKGQDIIERIQYLRHSIIVNDNKVDGRIYGEQLADLLFHLYIHNGTKNATSIYEAEHSGQRMLLVNLAESSANLAASLGEDVGYMYTEVLLDEVINGELVPGKIQYCFYSIVEITHLINTMECFDPTNAFSENGVNYSTEAMIGTLNEINSQLKLSDVISYIRK